MSMLRRRRPHALRAWLPALLVGLCLHASAGAAAALFVVVSLVTGQVASVRAAWARIAVQVAGSWIAAIGLFMLGWAVRVR